jgi:exonuclease VII small subunit
MEEKRITIEEFKKKLIEFQKSKPVVLDEAEYSKELDETVLLRYEKGINLMDKVAEELKKVKNELTDETRITELNLAIESIDEAINAFSYGHLGHNRCARANKAAHSRAVLWYEPKNP